MRVKVNGLSRSDLRSGIRALETVADPSLPEPLDRFSTRELVEVFNAYVDVRQARIQRRLQAASRDFSRREKSNARAAKT